MGDSSKAQKSGNRRTRRAMARQSTPPKRMKVADARKKAAATKQEEPAVTAITLRWFTEASQVVATDNPLSIPYDVFVREATEAARFVATYWKPTATRPGLDRVKSRLPLATATEIRELVRAAQEAQTRLLLLVDPVVVDHGPRARAIVAELSDAIDFTLDDGVTDDADRQFAQMWSYHTKNGQRSAGLIQSLRNFASLAEALKDRLVRDDAGFDAGIIAEARNVADALEAQKLNVPDPEEVAAARTLRNRVLHLLLARVTLVRKAARRVFGEHPEILRTVTSTYERRRRAESRRNRADESTSDDVASDESDE